MAEKNHGIWNDRPAVQKAFDADPQLACHAVASVLTKEQAEAVEAILVPEESRDEKIEKLSRIKQALEKLKVDTTAVDAKLGEIMGGY